MLVNEELRRIEGPVYSVVTPFTKELEIDWPSLERYLAYVAAQQPAAIYAMAYNSRYAQLSFDEILKLNTFVVEVVRSISPRIPVIVGDPIVCSTAHSIEFASKSKSMGADAISLLFSEKFYSLDQVVDHFKAVGVGSGLPVLVHEMPLIAGRGGAQVHWPVDVLEAVLELDSVIGLKEDAKNPELTSTILNTYAESHSVILSGGGKRQFLSHQSDGAKSWLNGVGVWAPPVAMNFWRAIVEGDSAGANRVIEEIEKPFFDGPVKNFGWHLACRAALRLRGISQIYERPPMPEPSSDLMTEVEEVLDRIDPELLK